jgi:hypothetical protein
MEEDVATLMVHDESARTMKCDPLRFSTSRGVLLALLVAVLFGIDIRLVPRLDGGLGAFTTACMMHAVATVVGPRRSVQQGTWPW